MGALKTPIESILSENGADHHTKQVYFVKCGEYTKIGYTSRSIKKRFNGTDNPYPIEYIGSIITPAAQELEGVIHKHFKSKRHRGEWFKLDEADLAAIKGVWLP